MGCGGGSWRLTPRWEAATAAAAAAGGAPAPGDLTLAASAALPSLLDALPPALPLPTPSSPLSPPSQILIVDDTKGGNVIFATVTYQSSSLGSMEIKGLKLAGCKMLKPKGGGIGGEDRLSHPPAADNVDARCILRTAAPCMGKTISCTFF